MGNQVPVEVVIAEKCSEYLDGLSPILQNVNRTYDSSFKAQASTWGNGQTINVKKPPRYSSQSGPAITSVQDINVRYDPREHQHLEKRSHSDGRL